MPPSDNRGQYLAGTRGYAYSYVVDFPNVSAGSQVSSNLTIDAGNDFEVLSLLFSANLANGVTVRSMNSIVGPANAGGDSSDHESVTLQNLAKLPRSSNPNGADVLPGLHLLRMSVTANDKNWQSAPTRVDLVTGEPGLLFFFPKSPILQANSSLTFTLYNDMPTGTQAGASAAFRNIIGTNSGSDPIAVSSQLVLFGSKIVRG
jgi:hypothetical protein